jgi:hypothetical protein
VNCFRFDPALVSLHAQPSVLSHGGGKTLGARPRTLPNRVKWKRPFLCAKRPAVDFCYDLRRASTTSSVRSSLVAPSGGRFRLRRRVSPRFPRALCRRARRAIAPSLSRGGGQRATTYHRRLSQGGASPPESEVPKTTALRCAACEATPRNPPSVAPRAVEAIAMYDCGPTSLERRADPPFRRRCLRNGERWLPSSFARRAPLGRRCNT